MPVYRVPKNTPNKRTGILLVYHTSFHCTSDKSDRSKQHPNMAPLKISSLEAIPNNYEFSIEDSTSKSNAQSKERRLLFCCLDVFSIWFPEGSLDSGSTVVDTESTYSEGDRNDVTANFLHQGETYAIADTIDCKSEAASRSCNINEHLEVHRTAETDSLCELSFAYSSFSEEDHPDEEQMLAVPQEIGAVARKCTESNDEASASDEASAAGDSILSFDSNDFLEDDENEKENENSEYDKHHQTRKLETIAESFEEFQARSQRSLSPRIQDLVHTKKVVCVFQNCSK